MKRPSFQFYPADWASNPNLKRCTFAEKGVWLEVMCLMHDQAEYGVLRWPLKEVAEAVKCKPAELMALQRKGVLKGSDTLLDAPFVYVPRSGRKDGPPVTLVDTQAGPIWYSSRMVKDEYVRTLRADSGGNGETPKPAPKPPLGETFGGGFGPRGSSSSSSPSVKEEPFPHDHAQGEGLVDGHVPTPAGTVCRAMRQIGIADTNPGHPDLLALIAAGATDAEFAGAAQAAVDREKGFAYALGVLKGQRTEAAKSAQGLHQGPLPAPAGGDRKARQLATAGLMTGAIRPSATTEPETFDADAARFLTP